MSAGFTKLASPELFPGAVTRIHTGTRQLEIGDIISVEWLARQHDVGNAVTGEIKNLALEERTGTLGRELACQVTLERGWYRHELDSILTPEPGSEEDEGESVLSFKPSISRADHEFTWELSTSDSPGWHVFILGASEERLHRIAELIGKTYAQLVGEEA